MTGKYKLVKVGKDGWVHMKADELQKLLDEVYNDGYEEGSRNKYYWSTFTLNSQPKVEKWQIDIT